MKKITELGVAPLIHNNNIYIFMHWSTDIYGEYYAGLYCPKNGDFFGCVKSDNEQLDKDKSVFDIGDFLLTKAGVQIPFKKLSVMPIIEVGFGEGKPVIISNMYIEGIRYEGDLYVLATWEREGKRYITLCCPQTGYLREAKTGIEVRMGRALEEFLQRGKVAVPARRLNMMKVF